jgi:Flp pilus assembly pilin Flp
MSDLAFAVWRDGNARALCTPDADRVQPPHVDTVICEFQNRTENQMKELMRTMWAEDEGQDIAEYAVMLAVILVLVVGTIRLIGTNANTIFSQTASAIG